MAPMKNRNVIANKPKSGLHPTYLETIIFGNNHIETEKNRAGITARAFAVIYR